MTALDVGYTQAEEAKFPAVARSLVSKIVTKDRYLMPDQQKGIFRLAVRLIC